ncbi:MAG: aromatic amino acid ammonia-lyase [Bacteroidales bacterium]|nr:aromatic amino acid ammonia-lyase [Bacteroidales bacterium]
MLLLNGYNLTSKDLNKLSKSDTKIGISEEAAEKVKKSFEFLKSVYSDLNLYGINTGLGPMAQVRISDDKLVELQYNLVRSHTSGFPNYLDNSNCKAVFVSRLNSLIRGHSSVSGDLIDHMVNMYNNEIIPCIPIHGGVGASGDLVQLAHLALAVIGEGTVYFKGQQMQASEAYVAAKLQPSKLVLREGLALINGTSAMTGVGALNIVNATTALEWMLILSVMINEAMEAFDDHLSAELNAVKKHAGQSEIARLAREILKGSKLIRARNNHWDKEESNDFFKEKVQEYYSLRCIPQILGPVYDTLSNAAGVIENELNSTSDNPIIDFESENIFHGGNFHGDYISLEMDKLKLVMTRLSMLSERQLNYLLNNRLNGKLPSFINLQTLGLNFGLQGLQFTATSTTSENQTLSTSSYIHSISSNNDNQDIVSMGFNSACIAARIIENTLEVITIEAVAVLQAIDALNVKDRLSDYNLKVYDELRKIFPVITSDRPTSLELEALKNYLKQNGKGLIEFNTISD